MKIIQSKFGPLTVVERIKNIWKIQCYVCRNEKGMYLCKVYTFPECEKAYLNEIRFVTSLSRYDSALPLLCETKSDNIITLVYDYTTFSTLDFYLRGKVIENYFPLIRNILNVLSSLHSRHIIHKNICIENIFIDSALSIRLGGFEFSSEENSEVPIPASSVIRSKEFQSPELLESGFEITTQSDMWSFGCVVYEIICKDRPFFNLEDQMKGKWKENLEGFWKVFVKKLLVVDPKVRANSFDMNAMLTAEQGKTAKKMSVFTAFFSKSTRSWVKLLTHNSDVAMNSETLNKIIGKAIAKPQKIQKCYEALMKRPKYHPKVCLKCLLLLHNYLFITLQSTFSGQGAACIDEIISLWTSPQSKNVQKYFTGTSRQVILEYCEILKEKYRIHITYSVNSSWSTCKISSDWILKDLVNFYSRISKFISFIFNLNDLIEIYLDVIKIFSNEQKQLNELLSSYLTSKFDSNLIDIYMDTYRKNIDFLHQFYLKHPLIDISPSSSPLQISFSQYSSSISSSLASSVASPDISIASESMQESDEIEFALTSDLEFKEIIGQGSSCTVYKGIYKEKKVAIKLMKKNSKDNFMKEFNREVQTLSKLRHPNLVMLIGACVGEQCCIVTEFCAGNTLFNLLHERKEVRLSWAQRLKFAKDIAEGMAYLHAVSPPIIHRDLKSLNLLLADEINGPEDATTVKITDFGVSRLVTDEMMTGHIGTCHWMAPEVLRNQPYGLSSDVYSFGIVLWEILARETPYKGMNPSIIPFQVTSLDKRPDLNLIASSCPQDLKEIMQLCWDVTPQNRPDFQQVVQMLGQISLIKS